MKKFTIKTAGGKIFTRNANEFKKYIINDADLHTALKAKMLSENAVDEFDIFKNKTLYHVDKVGGQWHVLKVLVVRCKCGHIMAWSNQYLDFEDDDVLYTNLEDAKDVMMMADFLDY